MGSDTLNFGTGPATVPDVGTLSYNGLIFSPLFLTDVSGTAIEDEAKRTVKYMEYSITVDGYVTMPFGSTSIASTVADLSLLLTQQGGSLVYQGRGMDLLVNPEGGGGAGAKTDVAWGPVPELLEFQPLGGGLSAKVRWRCKTRIPETTTNQYSISTYARGGLASFQLLQFNYETSVTYNEEGFSTLTIRGVMEIPLTRTPSIETRTLTQTVDDARTQIDSRIMSGVDLTRFRVSRREFAVSRDKRTMVWEFALEEKPYMDFPPGCTIADGTYSVRPARTGPGLVMWLCTLRATYTVRNDLPRRTAWLAFLALLRLRMNECQRAPDLGLDNPGDKARGTGRSGLLSTTLGTMRNLSGALIGSPRNLINQIKGYLQANKPPVAGGGKKTSILLLDMSFDEGIYKSSKSMSFSATWRLVCPLTHILLASGMWTKVEGPDRTLWSASVRDISGSQSWLRNRVDPKLDVIVDIGGG